MRRKTPDDEAEQALLSRIAAERRAQIGVHENIQHLMWDRFLDDERIRMGIDVPTPFASEALPAEKTALPSRSKVYLTPKETERVLNIGHSSVAKYIRSGLIPTKKIGPSRRVDAAWCYEMSDKNDIKKRDK
jgi:hypothetical protein